MRWWTAVPVAVVAVALTTTSARAATPPDYGIPPATNTSTVAARLDGRITLAKADGPVDMPVQTLRVYAYESFVRHGATTTYTSRSWIVGRTGPTPRYGFFAPVAVTGQLGIHTVVATFSQQQLVDAASATYLPLTITTRQIGTEIGTTTVSGGTVLHVDALQVDGTTVDVGPSCATSSALRIRLTSDPGWTDLAGGFLRGTFTVPPFTGCDSRHPGQNSTLTTAFSGPDNTVVLARGRAGTWDTTVAGDCSDCGRPPVIP